MVKQVRSTVSASVPGWAIWGAMGRSRAVNRSPEFAAVDGAAAVDLWVHAGYQHDCPEQGLVAGGHRGYLADGGFDQGGCL
jgi:hypothetical protein